MCYINLYACGQIKQTAITPDYWILATLEVLFDVVRVVYVSFWSIQWFDCPFLFIFGNRGGERILRKFTSGIFYIFRWFSSTCLKITKYENPLFLSLLFLPRSYREREPCHFFFVRAHQKNMKESWALLSEFLTDNSQLRHSLATSRGGKSSFVQSRGYETQTTARTTKQARNQWIGQENGPVNQTDKCQFSIRSIGA